MGFKDENGLCLVVDPLFKPCRKRKLLGGVDLKAKDHAFDVSRKDAGQLSVSRGGEGGGEERVYIV